MSYLDRSPGAFIILANLVVFGVVGVEIWMWTVSSVAAVAVTLVLIIVCAALICRAALDLMADGATRAPAASTSAADPVVAEPATPQAERIVQRTPARPLARDIRPARPV